MQTSEILSKSFSQREGQEPNVSPAPSQHPFGLECKYFGCYLSDPDDAEHIYTFPTATCTFPARAQSSVLLLPTTFPTLSSTPVKPTSQQMLNSVVLDNYDYPSKDSANSTGMYPGRRVR